MAEKDSYDYNSRSRCRSSSSSRPSNKTISGHQNENENNKIDECPLQECDEHMKGQDSGDDYSSGSDRSIEVDDAEDGACDSGSGGGANENIANSPGRRRRKKRHGSHGSRRQKGGSRHKHRSTFQPYPSKDELGPTLKRKSLELQEKENAAAVLRRDEGDGQLVTHPVAPFNSTQYLMDEHSVANVGSPKAILAKSDSCSRLVSHHNSAVSSLAPSPKTDVTDMFNFLPKDITDKEFSEFYSSVQAENLQSMTKEQLVKSYMKMEETVASLRRKMALVEQQKSDCGGKSKIELEDKDSITGSDTNSLSSANEEFVDLSLVNHSNAAVQMQGQSVQMDRQNDV